MIPTRHQVGLELAGSSDGDRGLGKHIILELYGCDSKILGNIDRIKKILLKVADAAQLNVLGIESHQFDPYGVTSMVIISESHLSIHTWPEYGFAAADIFTCSDEPWTAAKVLVAELKPYRTELLEITRGRALFSEGEELGELLNLRQSRR